MGIGLFTAGWMGYERFKQGAKYGQVLAESIPAIIGLAVGLNQVVHLNMGMSFGIAAGAVALLLAILQQMVQPSDKALDPTDPQNIAYSRPITMPQATGPWDSLVPEGTVIPILATVTAIAVGSMSLDFTKQKGETYSFAAGVLPAVTQKLRESSKPFSGDDLIGRSFLKRTDKDHIAYVTRQTRVNNQGELETSYKLNHRTLNSNGYEIIPGKPTAMNSFFLVDWINKTIHPREDASSDLDTQTTMSNLSNSSAVSADGAVGALRLGASQGHGGGE
jgi:hypothetical protein